ncbi:MAG TPA: hypothetical protein VHZ54_19220 [Solirubrobacterales bacterium]|jgi:hypothetical protein|nr:hypothetical protein [Solirubrobacterales bacterium]
MTSGRIAELVSGMSRLSRWLVAALALIVVGSVAILVLGHSDAAEATPKQLAQRDVEERLAFTPLPPGTHRVDSLPKTLHLDGPGEEPATPNLVDRGARYVTSMGAARALAWFEAHPPAGSGRDGGGSTGTAGGGTVVREVDFAWPDLPTIRGRALLVAVAARPSGGAAVRVDAQAVWVKPVPPLGSPSASGGRRSGSE